MQFTPRSFAPPRGDSVRLSVGKGAAFGVDPRFGRATIRADLPLLDRLDSETPSMPLSATPAERRALLFLAGVACLGLAVRAAGAVRREPPRAEQRAALARQIDAVDSARAAVRAKGRGAASARTGIARAGKGSGARADYRVSRPRATAPPASTPIVDVDVASAAELEALPRVGPALARRIVADRDSLGAFGSLGGLERVKGVGPALIGMLQGHVTFSGTPRLSHAVTTPPKVGERRPPSYSSQATRTSSTERGRRKRRP
ncbi:MAG TPA: helix-hairpin-helix domain-containing protein [Gaiellaceae bacterium]|nr:helix-hairpin-helix domain-containing protein [Gaiellaceae bacterium]